MSRYICIHGHFYQLPRENPWLEEVEVQDSAFPYHDWNERITAECYAPNAASRILDHENRIIDIVNNYSMISFNFGPTLLSWMETHEPEAYQAILEADRISQNRFRGYGSAIAQPYNHMIMPLANQKDKRTQILWGIKDFERRFKRKPLGMWLPETAIDLETLEILAEQRIEFTILAPHQAMRVRRRGDDQWVDVSGGRIDPRRPYTCRLPSGKTIALFFYDGPVSMDVAFGRLLENGTNFACRLMKLFSETGESELVHVATDGETYGHHHAFGDMALSSALHYIESNHLATITNYSEFLHIYPPTDEVEIFENSSWSCVHGVERWRSDCGCHTGMHGAWTQAWRAFLRQAMDWLRDQLIPLYENAMMAYGIDPWEARDDYIHVILDRSAQTVERYFQRHCIHRFSGEDRSRILKLLEMQRFAMLMYTSCGWFFDELSGIEAVHVMQYANRAMQLCAEVSGKELETGYLKILEQAPSNIQDFKNGKTVWDRLVRPARVDHLRIAAHYSVSSLFTEYPETIRVFSYTVRSIIYDKIEIEVGKLALGKARIKSDITWEEKEFCFAALHLGDHNLLGGVSEPKGCDDFALMRAELKDAFLQGDIAQVSRLMEKHYGSNDYFLWHLFRDEQQKVLYRILEPKIKEIEAYYRSLYEQYYPMIRALTEIRIALPPALSAPVEYIINADLCSWLNDENIQIERIKRLLEESRMWPINLDRVTLGFMVAQRITGIMKKLYRDPYHIYDLEQVIRLFEIFQNLSLDMNLWKAQNIYFDLATKHYTEMKEKARLGDPEAEKWVELCERLEKYFRVRRPQYRGEEVRQRSRR